MANSGDRLKQGAHPDPLAPDFEAPDPACLSRAWTAALASPEMAAYRAGLRLPNQADIRAAVLDDLSTYYLLDPQECLRRCLNWEVWSVEEWQREDRSTPEGIRAFYNSTFSWSFDLLWYAYLQAEGVTYPTSAVVAQQLPLVTYPARCLDFGSGVGDAAQLLLQIGHSVDLADVSETLLTFARWRLERRGQEANYIDLNTSALPHDAYDVVMAKDVLAHVPDYRSTVEGLHRSLRRGGILITNFDTRPPSPENAWHLYSDDLPLRRTLQDIGFDPVSTIDGYLFIYRRAEPGRSARLLRRTRNAVLLGPPRRAYRRSKALIRGLATRWRTPRAV